MVSRRRRAARRQIGHLSDSRRNASGCSGQCLIIATTYNTNLANVMPILPLACKPKVLPQSRLAVSGFKSRYALGERVELVCSSNFSRPRGALAWFINDLRVSFNQPAPTMAN